MPKRLNDFRQQTMREMMLLMNDMNRLTSSQGFKDSLNLGLTDQIMSANKAALTLGQTLQKSVNPLTGNLNLTAFNNELKRSSMTLTDYSKQLSQLGSVGQESFKSLTKAIISAETPLTAGSKLAQEMGVVIGNTMRWQAASSAIHGVLNTASQAVNYVRSLDSSLNDIRIVTGQSEEQMERFARQANQAAKELNTTTNQYAKASLIYYQQGLSDKQVADRTETTIKLANVSGQTAKTVSDQMTAIWNNFYNGSKSLEYYADVITALGATTASSSEEIAKGLSKFSSIAQTTGLSYEYATSALSTVVAATRQSADSVGTSFKTLFSRLQGLNLGQTLDDGTTLNKYSKALLTAGVNIKNTNGSLKDMDTILSELGEKWKNLGEAEQVALAQTIGGARNYSTFMALMEHQDEFYTNLKTIQGAEGTLQKQADIYADSWAAASAHVRASAESIYSNLVDDKVFKGMINGFGDVLDWVGKATDTMGGFGGVLAQVGAIAARSYGPQLAEGLSNLKYSAMSLLPGGQQRVDNIRKEALENLTSMGNLSPLERTYATNFAQRNQSYLDQQKRNILSQADQSLMLQRMNYVDELEQIALQSDKQFRQTNQDFQTAVNMTNSQIFRTPQRLSEEETRISDEQTRLRTQLGNLPQPGHGTAETEAVRRTIARELADLRDQNDELTNQRIGYRNLVNAYGGGLPSDFQAQYRQALRGYSQAVFEEGILTRLGNTFNPSNIYNTWDKQSVSSALSGIEKLIQIGNGQGASLSKMATSGLLTGEQINAINAMTTEFRGLQAKGIDISDARWETFLNDPRWEPIRQLGLGTGIADDIGREIQERFDNAGLGDIGRQNLAGARGIGEQEIQRQTDQASAAIANKNLNKSLEDLKSKDLSFGQAGFRAASSVAGIASSALTIANAAKVFKDETSTSADKIGATVGALMTLPMGIHGLSTGLKDVGTILHLTTGGSKIAGWTGLIGAAAIGAGLYGYSKYQEYKDNNDYGRLMENAQRTTTNLSQYSTIAKETASEFSAVNQQYLSNIQQLSEYETGSIEYTQALVNANQSALELKDNYGLSLSDIKVTNGIAMVDQGAIQARQEKLDEIAKQSAENSLIASSFLKAAELGSEHYHAITEEALRVATSSGTGLLSPGKEYVDRWNGEHFYNGSESEALTYKTFMDQISSTVVKDYTAAEIGQFAKQQKEIYEQYYGQGTFTLDNLIQALNYGGYDSETGKTQYSSDFYKINFQVAKDKNINQTETLYSKGNLFSNNSDIYHILNNIYGQGTITNDADALSQLLQLGEEADNFDLLQQRVNSEATNLFNLVAGFNASDNVYSNLAASILAQTTNFEDINQATGGTLLNDIKKITDMESAQLYQQYRNKIDENATDNYLTSLGDQNIIGSLVGHLINETTTNMLNQKIDEISTIPGLTEEFLKSYNNLNNLNEDAVKSLLAQVQKLTGAPENEALYKEMKQAVEATKAKFGEDYKGNILSIGADRGTYIGGNPENIGGIPIAAAEAALSLMEERAKNNETVTTIKSIINETILKDLANIDNQLLTSLYGSINNEDLRNLLGGQDVTDRALLETLTKGMSSNDKQTLANYVTAFGSQFGSDMAAEVFRGLVQEGTTIVHDLGTGENYSNKYIDRNYLNVLNRLDTTNAISTLYSAEQQSKLLGQNNEYGKRLNDLVEKGFESIGGEVGFFKSLWNSGEFSGLFSKLTSDASMVSMINAEVIDKAANKMDILNQALNTGISNLNSAGLASIMQEVAKGTLSQGNITESVIDAMSAAGYGDSTRVEALENIAELSNYSDSSISIIEKAFANQGKAFTSSFYQNQFWDQPLQEVLQQLPTGIESKYRELLINAQQTGQSSKDFQRTIRNEMPEFYKYITTVGTKKGDISNVLQFWKDIGMFSPGEKTGLNNLMMYDPSTGFFGFNPDAIGTSIPEAKELGIDAWTRTLEQTETEQALMKELDRMGVLEEMLVKNEDGTIKEYGEPGAGEHHIEANIDTEKQARNLMLAEAHLNGFFAGKSDEEIIQQYIDPAILYMREQGGMGAIWDSGEAIEGVRELQEGGKLTSAEAVRAFFNQYGSKILDENGKQMFATGDKGYEDFLAKYFPDADTTLSSLYQGVFATEAYANGVTQEQFAAAANNGLTFDDWLKGQSDVYNKETGAINYDAAMEAMRQSGWFKDDTQIASLLKDYGNTQLEAKAEGQKITATIRDMYGRQQQITLGEGKYQTIDDFQKAIEDSANITDADIQANNARQSQMDSMLINQAMQAGNQSKAASILMGLSDQGRQMFGQYANYLGLGEAWQTAETRSSAQYQQSSLDKGITNAIKQDQNAGKGNDNLVEYNGVNVSAEQLTKVQQALKAIEENTGTTAQLQDALNGLVEEGNEEGVNALTGKKGDIKVDDDGTIRDSEGNIIEFDENGNPVIQSNGSGGGYGGDSGNQPGEGPGTGPSSPSNPSEGGGSLGDRLEAAFKNGEKYTNGDPVIGPDGTYYTYWENENGDYGLKDAEGNNVDLDQTIHQLASGQNNNLIPQFAAGTGTIAVTGELGPELYVKPNGDMDLLGKHGREYAWVEPNDKIYTAAQTTSILGSKKIREMINGFSSGINNFIPGYGGGSFGTSFGTNVGTLGSPSSGGGGSSGGSISFGGGGGDAAEAELTAENHRFDANWLKYRDILERYYTILQQLEDLANELQRFATLADRAWGRTRIDNIEKTIEVQEQQVTAQRAYLSEINTYLRADREQMTKGISEFVDQWNEMYPNRQLGFDGAQFDQNGVLTNYRQIVESMLDAYNMDVSGYGYASGLYSVGAAGSPGQGLFSALAGAIANGIISGLHKNGEIIAEKRVTGPFFASGQNNEHMPTTTVIESVTTKTQENPQQTILEEKLKDIQFYTQTLNLYQQQLTVLEQMQQQLFDTRLQAIQVEVEYKVALKNNALNLLDYSLAKVRDDAYMAAEAVSLIGQEQDINIGILEDYEQELKDILNLNLNGEQFFGSNDLILTPTMNMSQIEKDLQSLSELHEKFWDEDSQHYLDKYKENIKTGEIFFDEETKNKATNNTSMFKDYLAWDEADEGAFYTNSELIGDDSSRGEDSSDKDIIEHNIDEYNALVARLYEKYYANYSQYLPDPEEFLQFRNSKERLQRLEEIAEAIEKTNTTGRGSSSGSSGRGGSAAGGPTLSDDGRSGSSVIMSSIGGRGVLSSTSGSEAATELPDYLYLIDNVDEALERLEFLSNLLNKNSIKVDIDKFTGEFKNIPEVTEQLQSVFDELIIDFPKLGKEIEDVDKKLIHFDDTTQRWILDINSYQDANKVLEKINATNRQKLTNARFEQFKEDPVAFWNWATDLSENFDFTNFTANQIQMLNQLSTTYLSNISNLKNSVLTQIDYLGNSVKAYAKDMDTVFNKFDHYKNLYADWQNIIDLTGRSTTKLSHDLILQLNNNVVDNSINKLASAKNQFDSINHMQELAQARYLQAQAELDAFEGDKEQRYWLQNIVDEYKLNLDKINKETEEAEDAYMKSWEDALQGLTTAFQQAVKDAAAGFEESFSPIYNTLDALSSAIERQRALRDLYMSPYEQAHGLSQMARDIKQSILDTDNINSKKELKKLLNDINDAQEDGVKLSSYDLDVMQKKYDLELARQALEDAKNAKSLVRLSRDNNGNWGYVYTANEDDIDEAEQRYEDAILAMEQTNQNYIDSLQDQLLQVWGNAEAQIAALNPSDFATEEEFKKRVAEITNLANEQIKFIQEQMKNALNNNNYLLDNVSGNAANIMKDLTTSFDNTILASLVGTDNIDDLAEQSIGNVLDLGEKANNAYSIFQTRNAEVWATAGADINNASETINSAIENIGDLSLNNVNEMSKVVDRATVAFNNLNNVLDVQAEKIYNVVVNYEQIVKSMTKLIELSGEYIKQNTMTLDSTITRWDQLDDIYNTLMTDGSVWLKYLDDDGKWIEKFLEVGTKDTLEWLNEQRYKLVNTLLHSEADEFIFKSQSELDGYYNAIKELVETRGLIKLDIKGDLLDKILNITEEDLGEDGDARLLELKNYFDNVDKLIDEKGNRLDNGDTVGLLTLDAVHNEAFVKEILELLRSLLEIKEEEEESGGWDVSDDSGPGWYEQVMETNGSPTPTHNDFSYGNKSDEALQFHHMFGDTGMYTGRWQSMDTGGYSGNWYTGEWPNGSVRRNGRLAWLHQKELVLNAHDTENFLDAMEIVRQLDNLTNWMANGLGVLAPTNVEPDEEILQQEVNIHAEFPNVTDHHEIEDALNNLVNRASQYVNRR